MGRIAGVDGCSGGWIAVSIDTLTGGFAVQLFSDSHSLFATDFEAIALDMPIGLPDERSRLADTEARNYLKPHRHSSVFPAPIRQALCATTRVQASEISKAIIGKGVGAQAFGLYPRIRQIDELFCSEITLQDRIYEVHPEVCFASMNNSKPLQFAKKSAEGRSERIRLLSENVPGFELKTFRNDIPNKYAADDDILDATAALWTCQRIVNGVAQSMPDPPQFDANGVRAAIWY